MPTPYTTEIFVNKAKTIHGDKYSYDNTIYLHNKKPVIVVCKTHGPFSIIPNKHISSGRGCPKCGLDNIQNYVSSLAATAAKEFTTKAENIHNGKYKYENVKYQNNRIKISITCEEHGDFLQTPTDHLSGKGCPKCKFNAQSERLSYSTEEFIVLAQKTHKNAYDYSKSVYNGSRIKVIIVCKKHGEFLQSPSHHLSGSGCPLCKESKGEKYIAYWLNERNIPYHREVRIKDFNPNKPFDFYLPTKNMYIEYDGIQHFKPQGSWASNFHKQQKRDTARNLWCKNNKINLVILTYLDDLELRLAELLL